MSYVSSIPTQEDKEKKGHFRVSSRSTSILPQGQHARASSNNNGHGQVNNNNNVGGNHRIGGSGPRWTDEIKQQMCINEEEVQAICGFLNKQQFTIDQDILGRGGNGIVAKGVDKDGCLIAIKILKCESEAHLNNNIREFKNMAVCQSQHVVRPKHLLHFRTTRNIFQFLVMERCQTDLKKFMKEREAKHSWMSKKQVYEICQQLIVGLADLHKNNILHLDIKPANVLLGFDQKWKFTDLGVSKNVNQGYDHTVNLNGITAKYASPEQFQLYEFQSKKKITRQSDVYSLGVLFLEMSGVDVREKWVMKQKVRSKDFAEFLNPEYKVFNDFVLSPMLQYLPSSRATLDQIYGILVNLVANEAALISSHAPPNSQPSDITLTASSTQPISSVRKNIIQEENNNNNNQTPISNGNANQINNQMKESLDSLLNYKVDVKRTQASNPMRRTFFAKVKSCAQLPAYSQLQSSSSNSLLDNSPLIPRKQPKLLYAQQQAPMISQSQLLSSQPTSVYSQMKVRTQISGGNESPMIRAMSSKKRSYVQANSNSNNNLSNFSGIASSVNLSPLKGRELFGDKFLHESAAESPLQYESVPQQQQQQQHLVSRKSSMESLVSNNLKSQNAMGRSTTPLHQGSISSSKRTIINLNSNQANGNSSSNNITNGAIGGGFVQMAKVSSQQLQQSNGMSKIQSRNILQRSVLPYHKYNIITNTPVVSQSSLKTPQAF